MPQLELFVLRRRPLLHRYSYFMCLQPSIANCLKSPPPCAESCLTQSALEMFRSGKNTDMSFEIASSQGMRFRYMLYDEKFTVNKYTWLFLKVSALSALQNRFMPFTCYYCGRPIYFTHLLNTIKHFSFMVIYTSELVIILQNVCARYESSEKFKFS